MLEIRLLGQFNVQLDGHTVELTSRSAQSLLVFLLFNRASRIRREKVSGILWPDFEDTKARKNLRQDLWRLRKTIGSEYFFADRVSIGFEAGETCQLDIASLEDESLWSRASEELVQQVAEYGGELLPGFYDEWVLLERERLNAIYEYHIRLLITRLLEEHRWLEAVHCSEGWIARGECPEPAYRSLLIAYCGLGDIPKVSQSFSRCEDALAQDLGVDPSADTIDLYKRILAEDATVLPRKRVHQKNIPQPLTSFIGREAERAHIRDQLADASCRLFTLIGPGGIGKTRIAIQVAHDLAQEFMDGVVFIPCENIKSGEFLITSIAESLGYSFSEGDEPITQLVNYLREKEILLVIDNMEHLLLDAHFLNVILEEAPGLKILTTSRERLNLYGEILFSVEGMPYPAPSKKELSVDYSAIELFLDRAEKISSGYSPTETDIQSIARICQLVDGTPLALELSSAWIQVLSCAQIAHEIEVKTDFLGLSPQDFPERQRSMRASFDHSWNLLSQQERKCFRRIAVFRGGFQGDAAQTVTGASLKLLSSLVNKSLLRQSPSHRFEVHGLLKKYIREKLVQKPKEIKATRDAHAKFYAAFTDVLSGDLRSSTQETALEKTGREIDNIRQALEWLIAQESILEIGKILDVLRVFYDVRGWYLEGVTIFGQIVEICSKNIEPVDLTSKELASVYGKALNGQAWMQHRLYRPDDAKSSANKSIAIADKFDLREIKGDALDTLGIIAIRQGYYPRAERLLQQCISIWKELGANWWQATDLIALSHVAQNSDRIHESREYCEQALELFRESNNLWGIASALAAYGNVSLEIGEFIQAEGYYQESGSISEEIGWVIGAARANVGLGNVALSQGNSIKAQKKFQDSLDIYRHLGRRIRIPQVLTMLGKTYIAQGQTQRALESVIDAIETAVEIDNPLATLNALLVLAELDIVEGKTNEAACILGYVVRHPSMMKSDQEIADGLISQLGDEPLPSGLWAELKLTENVGLSEFANSLIDWHQEAGFQS
jgi:predicted ATPase/DNA-binding SARP family transcriptional activator/lipopolysaccharide biosynthesis regulator YciM